MRTLKEILILIATAALLAAISGVFHPHRPSFQHKVLASDEVELATAMRWGHKILWVDARSEANFEKDHIPGSILLNEDHWDGFLPVLLDVWKPDRVIIVYCGSNSCQASRSVARRLRDEVGLNPTYVLEGGWEAWKAAQK
jgi:rhodanese-related sulfurtransferase